jgi:hypothetical protein
MSFTPLNWAVELKKKMSIPNIQSSGNPIQKTVVKGGKDIKEVSAALAKLVERRRRRRKKKVYVLIFK